MKVLFFVGKGGVGKSTSSALFALKLARGGRSVFLNSIDPAHNLHDIFRAPLEARPREIVPGLLAAETDLAAWVKRYLQETEREFKSIYRYQESFNLHRYFRTLRYSPGLEEYAVLLALQDTIRKHGDRDYIVFDTPPTALTLKFLALPRVSLLWLNELSGLRRAILRKKEIITRIKRGRGEPEREGDPILSRIESLIEKYRGFSSVLQDTQRTRLFIVLNRDRLSLAESATIWKELDQLELPKPTVILNRYERKAGSPTDGEFRATLKKQFPGAPILLLERQPQEVVGVDRLDAIDLPMDIEEL